jgi:hypothetical protein
MATQVEDFCPQRFVCQAVSHDQRRRVLSPLDFTQKVFPGVAIGESGPHR